MPHTTLRSALAAPALVPTALLGLLAAAPALAGPGGPVLVPLTDVRGGELLAIANVPGGVDAYAPATPFAPAQATLAIEDDDLPFVFASASLESTSGWIDLAPDATSATGFEFTTDLAVQLIKNNAGTPSTARATEAVDVTFSVDSATPEAPVFLILEASLARDLLAEVVLRLEQDGETIVELLEPGELLQPIELTAPATFRLVIDAEALISTNGFLNATESASATVRLIVDDVFGAAVTEGPYVNPCTGHAYYVADPATWDASRLAAVSRGGTLVTIDDAAENEWIRRNVAQGRTLWLGLNDRETEGTFTWVDGSPVAFDHWADGEPGLEDHAAMDPVTGRWRTLPDDPGAAGPVYGLVEVIPDLPGVAGGPYFNPTNGNTYWAFNPSDWLEANRAAANIGGRLVTINSATENGWVVSTIQTQFGGRLWIGLNDLGSDGIFSWISGAAVGYTNFGLGEPNGGLDDYAVAILNDFSGTWADLPPDQPNTRAVVEIGSCATDLDGNGETGFPDLVRMLGAWGPCGCEPADFDGNGEVEFDDLVFLIAEWGPC